MHDDAEPPAGPARDPEGSAAGPVPPEIVPSRASGAAPIRAPDDGADTSPALSDADEPIRVPSGGADMSPALSDAEPSQVSGDGPSAGRARSDLESAGVSGAGLDTSPMPSDAEPGQVLEAGNGSRPAVSEIAPSGTSDAASSREPDGGSGSAQALSDVEARGAASKSASMGTLAGSFVCVALAWGFVIGLAAMMRWDLGLFVFMFVVAAPYLVLPTGANAVCAWLFAREQPKGSRRRGWAVAGAVLASIVPAMQLSVLLLGVL
ncbi:hypothetical protein [Gulosibacter sp. 10]|uniref:hypothetical protein n=1 Tax=Gulosibacter sp. 10 TaxID=1255570 RepID=UPI0011208387|nr:hypothetical protein [Gulosibacter sp. 10]